jgi:hypothetical protein
MINFVFEDTDQSLNFLNCKDINPSGIRRFGTSPFAMKLINTGKAYKFDNVYRPENYIISASVNHSPNDWAKEEGCISYINRKQLTDVRDGRAMILLDQTLEGYQTTWLWEYLHNDCKRNNINPRSLIYVTGNMLAAEQYQEWAANQSDKILIIPYAIFESDVYEISQEMGLSDNFNKNLQYKKDNLQNITDYNCLQKRLRAHRIWFYNLLFKEKLLDHGLISMNPCNHRASYFEGRWLSIEEIEESNKLLPLLVYGKNNNECDDNYYIRRITDQIFLDSWVSVISEASFGDSDGTIFLSEKIFKPIACMHPFIIVGNKNSLAKLKSMGYKTFEGYIDESYDTLSTFERFDAIIKSIKHIVEMPDKLSWFESMKDTLIHNYNTLKKNSSADSVAKRTLENYYKEYFKL